MSGIVRSGAVVSVNVGPAVDVEWRGRHFRTGIGKRPTPGRIALRGVNLAGDDQADRNAHGGPVRAAYAYASEDYAWWSEQVGRALEPGRFGENLTLQGIDVSAARIGEQWRIGSAVVQVTSPRVPCYKLAYRMDDPQFVKRFADALRPGAYLAIVDEGEVGAGDEVAIISRPEHPLTIAEMAKIYYFERDRVGEFLVPQMPPNWRTWAEEQLAR